MKVKLKTKIRKAKEDGHVKKAMKLAKKPIAKKVADDLAIPDFLKRTQPLGGPMTRVQFKIMGGKAVKRSFYRTFDSVKDASEYFQEFKNKRDCNYSRDGRIATFPGSVDSIYSNMNLHDVLKLKPVPKVGLPDIVLPDSSPSLPTAIASGVDRLNNEKVEKPTSSTARRTSRGAVINGNVVPLKVLCADLKGKEGRDARIALRKAVRNAKKYPELAKAHAFNARWEFDKSNAALMAELKEVLS